ncbi:MAG: hypothetical protein HQ536_01775 [Parcubacteria group bacterium]|nr:hypothetical protein [Parcubacteria group bacterium]
MTVKNPKIKFVVSVNQDIKNYILFNKYSDDSGFLKMFLPKKLFYVLKSNFSERKKTEIITEYVNDKFDLCKNEINKNVKNIDKRWKFIEKKYFKLICKIFKNHSWPKGKYIGFASIFEMYPKNIKEKTFYFSGLKKDLNFNIATVAHEMLHFIFFDYIKVRYGINEGTELKNKSPKYIWNVSEVFNLVIETWKPYQKIFKTNGKSYYFMHKKMLPKMKRLWKEKENIDYLLDHYFTSR